MNLFLLPLLLCSCSSPPAPTGDALTSQFASSARAAYDRGSYPQAIRFYEQALQRARARDDGPEIARCAYNLAACQLASGQPAAARVSLRESLAETGRWRMDSQPAYLLDARAALAAGDPQEAGRVLDLAFAACKSDAQRHEVWLARGELAAGVGDADSAANALREADATIPRVGDDALWATRLDLAARIAGLKGDHAGAAKNFDAAANAWQASGQTRAMANALGRAGDALAQAGAHGDAADRYYRAARSLHAQGDTVGALRLIERGLESNTKAPDAERTALLTALFEDVRSTTGSP